VLPPGSLPLSPVAVHEGLIVASNLLHGNRKSPDYRGTPSVVFTVLPLARVGLTEAEARERQLTVQVKSGETGSWYSNRRVRQSTAMYKTIVEEGTNRVLGAHLLGPEAEEVINYSHSPSGTGLPGPPYPTRSTRIRPSDVPFMVWDRRARRHGSSNQRPRKDLTLESAPRVIL
jgi:hypothetical protein